MRKFGWKQVEALRRSDVANPKPFAGKYPTRVAWRVVWAADERNLRVVGGGITFKYNGKPCKQAIEDFFRRAQNPHCSVWRVVEYDRNAIVQKSEGFGRIRADREGVVAAITSAYLSAIYHYNEGRLFLQSFLYPWWPKRVSGIPFYSTKEKLSRLKDIPEIATSFARWGVTWKKKQP